MGSSSSKSHSSSSMIEQPLLNDTVGETLEAMWTHFAVELLLEGGITAKLERTPKGVLLTQRGLIHKECETWSGTPPHTITMSNVTQFYHKENAIRYSMAFKNCKHLAYDFFAEVVDQRGLGDFGDWCQPFEQIWKAKQAW